MSVKTASLFTCDVCKDTGIGLEGAWEVPIDWFTIRISKNISATTADDLHICPSCKYNELVELWEKI